MFIPIYKQLCEDYEEKDPISPMQVAMMLVDWTDPQKAVYVVYGAQKTPTKIFAHRPVNGRPTDDNVHVELASNIVKALFDDKIDSKSCGPFLDCT